MMWMPAFFAAFFLFTSVNASGCQEDVPTVYTSEDGCLDWKCHNWRQSKKGYVYLANGTLSGYLESRLICATVSKSCLKFQFWLKETVTYTLSVYLSRPDEKFYLLQWSYSRETKWMNATVPLVSGLNFTINITASREKAKDGKKIRIRNIVYVRSACEIGPPEAAPSAVASTDRQPMTTPTTLMTKAANANTTIRTTPTPMTTHISISTSNSGASGTLNSSALDGSSEQDKSPGSVAKIVGIVVAVVIVFTAGLLAFIFIRRKRFTLFKTWFGDMDKEDDNFKACHNNAYSLETEAVIKNENDREEQNTADTAPSYVNSSDNAASGFSQFSTEEYSVIRDHGSDDWLSAFEPRTSLYSVVQARSHTAQVNPKKPGAVYCAENPYKINDDPDNAQRPSESTSNGQYTKLDFSTKGLDEYGSASAGEAQCTPLDPAVTRPVFAGSTETRANRHLEEDSASQASREGKWSGRLHEEIPSAESRCREAGVLHSLRRDYNTQVPRRTGEEDGSDPNPGLATLENSNDPTATGDYHVLEEDSISRIPQQAEGGLYHNLEEPQSEKPNIAAEGLYHVLEDNSTPQEPGSGGEGGGLYHTLEKLSIMEPQDGDTGVYHVLEADSARKPPSCGTECRSMEPDTALGSGSMAEYNSLNFDRKRSVPKGGNEDTDKVYSHLNDGDEDVYNEVDRQKRREVIDGDYSHIQ